MILSKKTLTSLLLLSGLAGCGKSTPPLYSWQNFQTRQYVYMQGTTDPTKQILDLEKDEQKATAKNLALPPGFHAHLGMLYAADGKTDQAQQELNKEKMQFPESTTYMDFLLKNLGRPTQKASS
ncbi:DUF4810 domain-containing protein [Acetobacter thailandicus]|uniref:DUF4810 domain-containing protein n=1 Tax=Acetobacter thailandicus TaxID=1502842 RepID=UPI001BAB110A|nr:DUF4810 domain-containing protein [Acetobacter thailandicus]MBS0960849.1 DUF4810 domain-containing protein [Acetobacter thailandicus]MBS0981229.1 DUF4810 domain-containing protein [Acetobacter thailandicus]MBS0986761.1 DUF4810 domain-containing protein [Acetobacter thailandicus]MBS1003119.1 DUF4810 domain-containing protein [Acetobacter thailandicus]